MIKAINTEWEMDWTPEQIKWVQERYKHLSDKTLIRKQELLGNIEPDNLDIVTAANSRDLTADPRTLYQDIRLQTPLHQSAPSNPYMSQAPLASQSPLAPQIPHQLPSSQPSNQAPLRLQTPNTTPHHSQEGILSQHQAQEDSNNQYAKKLTLLEKIYKENDKFSDTGDNFDFKLTIFLDKCRRVGLPRVAFIYSAAIMLSDQALTHYYANRGSAASFDDFCQNMRTFFEGPEWERYNLTK